MVLAAFRDTTDPIFGLNPFELFLGIIVILVICWIVRWAWLTFRP